MRYDIHIPWCLAIGQRIRCILLFQLIMTFKSGNVQLTGVTHRCMICPLAFSIQNHNFAFNLWSPAEPFITFQMPHQFNHIDRGLCNQSDSSMMICLIPDSLLREGFGMPINGKWCAVPWKMIVIHFPPVGKRSPWQTNKLGPKPNIIWHVSQCAAILQTLGVFIKVVTSFLLL